MIFMDMLRRYLFVLFFQLLRRFLSSIVMVITYVTINIAAIYP